MKGGKDILSGFGEEWKGNHSEAGERIGNAPRVAGGVTSAKTLPYSPPKGPIGISSPKQGSIGGTNHGKAGTQGKH